MFVLDPPFPIWTWVQMHKCQDWVQLENGNTLLIKIKVFLVVRLIGTHINSVPSYQNYVQIYNSWTEVQSVISHFTLVYFWFVTLNKRKNIIDVYCWIIIEQRNKKWIESRAVILYTIRMYARSLNSILNIRLK